MDHETFAVVNQKKHNISSLRLNHEYDADAEAKQKIRSRPTRFTLHSVRTAKWRLSCNSEITFVAKRKNPITDYMPLLITLYSIFRAWNR